MTTNVAPPKAKVTSRMCALSERTPSKGSKGFWLLAFGFWLLALSTHICQRNMGHHRVIRLQSANEPS